VLSEGALARAREFISVGERFESVRHDVALRLANREAKRLLEVCPKDRSDAFKAETDLGRHRADEARRTGAQLLNRHVRRERGERAESLWPERGFVDRLDDGDPGVAALIPGYDARMKLPLKGVDSAQLQHNRSIIFSFLPDRQRSRPCPTRRIDTHSIFAR
jgi:hypothetical protein